MPQKACNNCYFYRALNNQCRNKPPVPFLAAVQPNGQGLVITAYPCPPQAGEDWCGEHIPDDAVHIINETKHRNNNTSH